jgi:hypothetical protein
MLQTRVIPCGMRLGWLVPLSLTSTLTLLGCNGSSPSEEADDDVGDLEETAEEESGSTADESGSSSSSSGTDTTDETDASTDDDVGTETVDDTGPDTGTETADTETDESTESSTDTDSETADTETETADTETETTDTGVELCSCADNTDLIFVLSDDGELWSFDPLSNQFAMITANLGCPQNQAFSMSVDRNGIAHVMFQNDDIFTVDVNNPNMCIDPLYQPGQLGFNKFGMGFVSNDQFDPCDKLYAHSWNGQGGFTEGVNSGRMGRLDPETLTMTEIDFIDYNGGELSGTGDGRLFAFAGAPAKLVEYEKDTAQVIATEQLNMNLTNAFAFGFYGGDFYMFTEGNNANFSKVTHYDYDDTKALTTVVMQAPIRIVGAGVSTCVPLAM